MDGWGWGGWLVMSIMMLLFWATVAAFVIWGVRSGVPHHQAENRPCALEIAKERYARGEINDEEFQRIKRGLT